MVTPQVLLQAQRNRYATKKFEPGALLPSEVLQVLLESLRLTPSSFGLQPWHFLVVQNQKIREQLKKASWNQNQVCDASVHLVFCRPRQFGVAQVDAFVDLVAKTRKQEQSQLKAYRDMMVQFIESQTEKELEIWMEKQIYIGLGNLLTSAALLGVDACPMEGFDPLAYDKILELPARGLHSVVACPLGFRSSSDSYAKAPKVRLPKESLFTYL